MPRVTCIEHPARSRFVALRPHYVAICDGNSCAAMVLSVFEHWTNMLLETEPAAEPWVTMTAEKIRAELLGVFGEHALRGALDLLVERGLVTRRKLPGVATQTRQYLLQIEVVQRGVQNLKSSSGNQALEDVISSPPVRATEAVIEPSVEHSPNGEGPKTAAPPPSDPPRNDESDFTLQEPPPPSRLFDAPDQVDQDIAEVWDYYVQINDPVRKDLTSQRKTMLKRALKEATVEECKLAIDGNRISQWHQQRSAHNLSDIFTKGRTGSLREKLDRFITDARKAGASPSKFATLDRGYAEECKATIRKMLAFKGSDRRFGEEAIQWLKEHGIDTIITDGDSEPRFVESPDA